MRNPASLPRNPKPELIPRVSRLTNVFRYMETASQRKPPTMQSWNIQALPCGLRQKGTFSCGAKHEATLIPLLVESALHAQGSFGTEVTIKDFTVVTNSINDTYGSTLIKAEVGPQGTGFAKHTL
ncbi:hypothetical protein ADUPG1_001976, partial [Aduncisulcus paluster]